MTTQRREKMTTETTDFNFDFSADMAGENNTNLTAEKEAAKKAEREAAAEKFRGEFYTGKLETVVVETPKTVTDEEVQEAKQFFSNLEHEDRMQVMQDGINEMKATMAACTKTFVLRTDIHSEKDEEIYTADRMLQHYFDSDRFEMDRDENIEYSHTLYVWQTGMHATKGEIKKYLETMMGEIEIYVETAQYNQNLDYSVKIEKEIAEQNNYFKIELEFWTEGRYPVYE